MIHVHVLLIGSIPFFMAVDSNHTHLVAASIREMLIHFKDMLRLPHHLPHLPDPGNGPAFSQNIVRYVEQDEWKEYKATVVSS